MLSPLQEGDFSKLKQGEKEEVIIILLISAFYVEFSHVYCPK